MELALGDAPKARLARGPETTRSLKKFDPVTLDPGYVGSRGFLPPLL